jgi:hypothetical protein
MLLPAIRASGRVSKDGANRFEILFGIVLQREILFFDGTADHNQPAAGPKAYGQH